VISIDSGNNFFKKKTLEVFNFKMLTQGLIIYFFHFIIIKHNLLNLEDKKTTFKGLTTTTNSTIFFFQ
jgi:hypothetical protein